MYTFMKVFWKINGNESILEDKSIHVVFTFFNSTTYKLFMIYILNV
jgi:hypothetical protein